METEVMDKKFYALKCVYPDQQVNDENSPEPVGLEPLLEACRSFYSDQPQPFQFIPELKSWQGGQCPLDFISVYRNIGNPAEDIAPHWHYIGFGLSDLYGDKRVHKISKCNTRSGYGIEVTFRLKREPDERQVPFWPASMMQDAAKYVFQKNDVFSHGDFLFYGFPFEEFEYSNIKDLLLSEDPQLGTVETPFGPVTFLQLVGVCEKELKAAWQEGGRRVIEVMKSVKGAGGPWLITDMRRDKTIFELDSSVQKDLKSSGIVSDFVYRCIRWYRGSKNQYKSSSRKNKQVFPGNMIVKQEKLE